MDVMTDMKIPDRCVGFSQDPKIWEVQMPPAPISYAKIQMHMGSMEHIDVWGCLDIRGASECMGRSKHTVGIQTYGGIDTP